MRTTRIFAASSAVLLCICGSALRAQTSLATSATKPVPLILEQAEGERRIVRGWPGHPDPGESFILKVDPKNGGSSHLVLTSTSCMRFDLHLASPRRDLLPACCST